MIKINVIIGKHFEFEACHRLPGKDIYGECSNLHGHRYELTVEIQGEVNEQGWVCNFKQFKDIVNNLIINKYDHSNLNDFFELPTVENMVLVMFNTLKPELEKTELQLIKVKLYETSNSYAEVNIK